MQILLFVAVVALGYIIGSVPFGLIIVRLKTGKDVRQIESGRTGGTNAMRAAGFWAGFFTGVMDLLKAAVVVWLARWLAPGDYWLHVFAPLAAVLGHNYSIFLIERGANGKWRLRGGAGGAPTAGGMIGLWFPSLLILVPAVLLSVFIIGYASVATLTIGAISILILIVRAWIGAAPWQYIFYGVFAELLLIWALRPNIKRLIEGTERRVGLFARKSRSEPPKSSSSRNHHSLTL